MSLTVGEVKENADYNINNPVLGSISIALGREQQNNYDIAKELGASDDDDWYEWEEKVKQFKFKNK